MPPVTYDEIAAIFMAPLAQPIETPVVPATPARRLRDALEPIATQGWWSRAAGEQLDSMGLPFLAGYVWGRAAALGTPDPSVVVATFGVFEPTMLTAVVAGVSAAVPRDKILAARAAGGAAAVDAVVEAADADAVSAPLLRALASVDSMGRPLFSALRSLPMPDSAGGRLWRAAELVREHRGDGHLAALATSGLDAVEANVLTELWIGYGLSEYSGTRGFPAEAIAAAAERLTARGWLREQRLTEAGLAARLAVEDATDRSQDRLIEAIGEDLEPVIDRAAAVSERLVAAGSFPPDPRKRAGG
jgi:hypothetical protein